VGDGVQTTSALDVLPNGHVLATAYGESSVREYDAGGFGGCSSQLGMA
jgi:hypothetical protein